MASAPFGILVAEPGGNLIACPVPESALIAPAPETVIGPSRTLVAVKAVVSHTSSFAQLKRPQKIRPSKPKIETIRDRWPFLRRRWKNE
jgi:hypothetical protein